ncbi:vacuolar protein sorting-associated protein [Colletotrichum higginsianum]|uniref:Vacuolar protein sorting-associated protein n=1 Tax=Colletotrichum higginsianum (strain IMI 349063) TaxID=759273 RepID=H1VCQ6_COLHI|nr:vacuolar protein sorting-associated protein [Colletotrichum higginsianum]
MSNVRDIPPVAITNIPYVDAAQFESYISKMGPLYEQLQRLKGTEDGRRRARSNPESSFECFETSNQTVKLSYPARDGRISSIPLATALSDDGLPNRQVRGIDSSRDGHYSAAALSIIPSGYFHQQFHLENPRIFDVVSEKSEVVPSNSTAESAGDGHAPAPGTALATNAILQEKLSWYMDTVEAHLVNSLAMASSTLFSALGSMTELHSEAGKLVEKVAALRQDLTPLDKDVVAKGLELTRKRQESHNVQQIHDAVLQLKRIVDGVVCYESLVNKGRIEKALAEMNVIESVMAGKRSDNLEDESLTYIQLRDLRGATALQGVASDLTILRYRIGKLFESKSLRVKGGLGREPLALPAYMDQTSELRTALCPILYGLHRYGSVSTAIEAYREQLLREIRSIVRKPLPSSTDDDDTGSVTSGIGSTIRKGRKEKSSILAQILRALDAEDAERLFSAIFISIAKTLRRLKTQSSVLLDIACAVGIPMLKAQSKFSLPRFSHMVVLRM